MYKNVANQKVMIYAYDTSNNVPLSGDASNITMYISKNGGSPVQSNDVNPTEIDPDNVTGVYYFELTQAETSADEWVGYPKTTTDNVQLEPVIIYPVPPNFGELNIESDGTLTKVSACDVNTDMRGTDNAALSTDLFSISATLDTVVADVSGVSLSAIADAVWDEIRSEHLTSGSFGEQMATSAGVLFSKLTESYASQGDTATLTQLLYMLWSRSKSTVDVSTTSPDSLKLDDSTVAMTFETNDSDNPTRMVRSS